MSFRRTSPTVLDGATDYFSEKVTPLWRHFADKSLFCGQDFAFFIKACRDVKPFTVFLKDAATRFNRIARSLRGQIKPEDLHADAWMVAAEIAEKRGKEIDFSDAADQDLVLKRIYWSVKDQRDWRLANAYSIDDDQEGRTRWADRLAAPLSTSPLEILLHREASAITDSALAARGYLRVCRFPYAPVRQPRHLLSSRLATDRLNLALSVRGGPIKTY